MTSLLASSFDTTPPTRVAHVSRSLDHSLLRIQPLNRNANMPSPLPIPSNYECHKLKWISDSLLLVLFSNNEEIWIIDSNLGQIVQTLKLKSSGSSVAATVKEINSITNVWIMDNVNRIYQYVIEGSQLQEIGDWKIDEIIEPISEIEIINNDLIIVSNSLYSYDLEERKVKKSLNLFVDQCGCLQIINENQCIVSSKNDRFINLVDINEFKVVSIFTLNDPCLKFQFQKMEGKNILIALDERGHFEVFNDPLNFTPKLSTNSKRRRMTVRSVQPQYNLKLNEGRFDDLIFNGQELVVSYFQNESLFVFDNYNWVQNVKQEGEVELLRIKPLLNKLHINNEDKASFDTYKEGNVVVGTSDNLLDIEEVQDDEDDEDDEDFGSLTSKLIKPQLNKSKGSKVQFAVGTLSLNLIQALKTSDNQAFNTLLDKAQDEQVIRTTVSRLDIHYVMKLLDKLGELNYKNKFQALDLNVWIKYLLIFHGNYIIGVPHLKSKLTLLTISLKNRSNNMKKLLELKGKLSMVTEKVEVLREIERFETNAVEDEEADVEYYEELEDADEEELQDGGDDDDEDEEETGSGLDDGEDNDDIEMADF